MCNKSKFKHLKGITSRKNVMLLCNILLVTAAMLSVLIHSKHIKAQQEETKLNAFISAVESMKQISDNYLATEEVFAKNWAKYIESRDFTLDEALDYIRSTNTQQDRFAHIVDMDTFEAYSTYERNGDNSVNCYQWIKNEKITINEIFISNMKHMFSDEYTDMSVLGKYKIGETQTTVISVGTRVTLRTENGSRDYLLLRVIPLESMKKIWIFPMQYSAAEVGLITTDGSYVIPSASMKSENFIEFIRSYNYTDDYNGVDTLKKQLADTDSGTLFYKNSKGQDCYWYYSEFSSDSGMDMIGCIPADQLKADNSHWFVVIMICSALAILVLTNGAHILTVNKNLRKAAADAEKANHAKTEFLSSMSHDIRTPMNAVLGMTEIAKKNIDDKKYALECLDNVSLAGNHLLTLVNDILDISKVESGKMPLNAARFSIKKLSEHLMNIIRPQMDEKSISFEGSYTDFPHEYLVADELCLNQIFINLLTNAVKYTNHGGRIRLDISEEPVPNNENAVTLVYRVSDNGIGMTEEFQKTMYDSFNRAENSRINKIQGSGLGLAIVKQMVALMDGTIECSSAPDIGSTFTVRIVLPIAEDQYNNSDPDSTADNEPADSGFNGINALVAEDNDLNWEIISTLLLEYGVVCTRAENGRECIDLLHNSPDGKFAFILMDIQMPVMNGREAASAIRADENEYIRSIPIAATTADAFADDIKACLDCGMNTHISKPIDIKAVLRFMRSIRNNAQNN